MSDFKYPLGAKAKDKVTGFEGIIIGRSEWLTGCNTYVLKPKAKDGEVKSSEYFDEGVIKILKEDAVKPEEVQAEKKGGPRKDQELR